MSFISFTFVFFLAASLILYYIVPKKFQVAVLCTANTVYYCLWNYKNLVFIVFSSLVTFYGAALVESLNKGLKEKKALVSKEDFKILKTSVLHKKRAVLSGMLLLNVGMLILLKYYLVIFSSKSLILPLGISYYTLQTIAYFMDVYNGKYEREHNFFRYYTFVSFFPQLLMGPINRYDKLGIEMSKEHPLEFDNFKRGVTTILYGAMKKYIVADMLVVRISDIFDPAYVNMPGAYIVLGVFMYAVYQYMDFSGGINMVLGIAKLFGLNMQPNFRQPYFSTSIADFWRRWHISLGLWMKDYIFYPLAFTKFMQKITKALNGSGHKHLARSVPAGISNIIVFCLVGVWHGPELHFLLWGLYNGLIIAVSDFMKPFFEKVNAFLHINVKGRAFHVFRIVRTFILVTIGGYFDRITDVSKCMRYMKNSVANFGNLRELFSVSSLSQMFGQVATINSQLMLVLIGCITVFVISILKENKIDVYEKIQSKNIVFRWLFYYVPIILVMISFTFSEADSEFMYAQY
ncbi:MBOAT family protein [Treponema rectale]|uniref:D-alanyl-lipoteichoic acid acyltransferase DltB (MBOAT superfamily) n=1 Tax=Treponema rectale TaxID=744512 RepID=A0A840SCE0_9SPIR|nr:MBOAT family protein [Treponema rectale]MBB5218390.1 D-alanyl-lipoteichoic acid acyltransferase DltB (MBOAT superfamily) [Treponema rectale]QOS39915.1 MBOAT family protein [Treponema rectale]